MNGFEPDILITMQIRKDHLWNMSDGNPDLPEVPKEDKEYIYSLYDSVEKILTMKPEYPTERKESFKYSVRNKDKRIPDAHLKSAKQKKKLKKNELVFSTRNTEIVCTGYLNRSTNAKSKYCDKKILELKLLHEVPNPYLSTSKKKTSVVKVVPEEIVCDLCGETIAYGKLNGEVTTIFCCIGLHTQREEDDSYESVERLDYCYVCVVEAAIQQKKLSTSIFHILFI